MNKNKNINMKCFDDERKAVENLLSAATRQNFIQLAEYYESSADKKSAAQAYMGIVPDRTRDEFSLEDSTFIVPVASTSITRLVSYRTESIPLEKPLNQDENLNVVFTLDAIKTGPNFLDCFESGVLETDGINKLFKDNSGTCISQHSTINNCLVRKSPVYSDIPEVTLKGRTAVLVAKNGHNFYHWFVDVLSQLDYLESAGILLSEVDQFIFTKVDSRFQKESINLLGIPNHKIVTTGNKLIRYNCDELLAVHANNRMARGLSSRASSFLRRKFLPKAIIPDFNVDKLAIYREKRGYSNNQQVSQVLGQRGYKEIALEDFPLVNQFGIFNQTKDIVSPHGAGLTHLLFSKPGTQVLELYGRQIQPCFWIIANLIGARYRNVNCTGGTAMPESDGNKDLAKRLNSEFDADVAILNGLLD